MMMAQAPAGHAQASKIQLESAEHAATIRFLELLMNHGPMTLQTMVSHTQTGHFTVEMRHAVGWSDAGLKKFLSKYPSLFTMADSVVMANDFHAPVTIQRPFDKIEQDAVDFFRSKLFKREDTWVPVVSVAGHLSQANADIRRIVGPQSDFKKFLVRHPEAFVIKGQQVSLKVDLPPDDDAATERKAMSKVERCSSTSSSTESPGIQLDVIDTSKDMPSVDLGSIPSLTSPASRQSSVSETPRRISPSDSPSTRASTKASPISIPSNEYKALMFIKSIVEKRGSMKLHNITGHFSQANESVRNTIGWTKYELEEFLKKHGQIFSIDNDENVSIVKDAKPNYILTGRQAGAQAVRSLQQRRAKVFHVAKLWGIIDLGKHEHVFFDRSIFPEDFDDLRDHFKANEYAYFNAVLSTKSSRAKWRATCVWKDADNPPKAASLLSGAAFDDDTELATLLSEPELDWDFSNDLLLSDDVEKFYSDKEALYYDQREAELLRGLDELNVPCTLPDSLRNKLTLLADVHKDRGYCLVDPEAEEPVDPANIAENPTELQRSERPCGKLVDQACQTLSTGDILATQLYFPPNSS